MWDDLPTSLLIFGGWPGMPFAKPFGIVAAGGVLFRILIWRGPLSLLAFLVSIYVGILALLDLNASGPQVYWTLPTLGYFERPLIPLYVIILISVVADVLQMAWSLLRARLKRFAADRESMAAPRARGARGHGSSPVAAPIILAILAALVLVIGLPGSETWHSELGRRPVRWALSENFVKELQLPVPTGQQFAPYFFDATADGKVMNCRHLTDLPFEMFSRYCGDMLDLHSARMFVEFHNLLDIQNQQMYGQAYALAGAGAFSAQRRQSFDALRSLGIRYLALDYDVESARHLVLGGNKVSLVDLGAVEPFLSARSVKFDRRYDAQEVLAARGEGVAIVHDHAAADLQGLLPVEHLDLQYGPDRVRLSASSSGNSLLLLPFQFSNCLAIVGDGNARLLRVNGAQAALHFNGLATVDVVNYFRLFGDAGCRGRDFADAFGLELWPRPGYEQMTDGRRVPLLMRMALQASIRRRDAVLAGNISANTMANSR
jgi:hypothetical protein